MSTRKTATCGVALLLTSCASVQTTWTDKADSSASPGLVYWMPKQDVLVNVKFAEGVPTVTIDKSEPYADTSAGTFVASFQRNWVGKNELKVGISDQGLLQSAKATSTSNLSEVLTELAKSVGSSRAGFTEGKKPPPPTCPTSANYTFRVSPDGAIQTFTPPNWKKCPISVSLTARPTGLTPSTKVSSLDGVGSLPSGASHASGFFYRQNLPYDLKVSVGDAQFSDSVVMLPNGSPTRFLPVSKSLFSKNVADIVFNKGILTSYSQDADSEALSLVKLPADVLTAYFSAIGAMFGTRSTAVKGQTDYETALLNALKQQYANEQCIAALTAKDDAKIEVMCKK